MGNHCSLAVTGDVILCCPFSHEMSWMISGTKLSQFLRVSYLLSRCSPNDVGINTVMIINSNILASLELLVHFVPYARKE